MQLDIKAQWRRTSTTQQKEVLQQDSPAAFPSSHPTSLGSSQNPPDPTQDFHSLCDLLPPPFLCLSFCFYFCSRDSGNTWLCAHKLKALNLVSCPSLPGVYKARSRTFLWGCPPSRQPTLSPPSSLVPSFLQSSTCLRGTYCSQAMPPWVKSVWRSTAARGRAPRAPVLAPSRWSRRTFLLYIPAAQGPRFFTSDQTPRLVLSPAFPSPRTGEAHRCPAPSVREDSPQLSRTTGLEPMKSFITSW